MAHLLAMTARRCMPGVGRLTAARVPALRPVVPIALQQRLLHSSPTRHHQAVNPGWPVMYAITYDKPGWDPEMELEYDVPAHIPPELSTTIRHTYYLPPQYYPFLKKP